MVNQPRPHPMVPHPHLLLRSEIKIAAEFKIVFNLSSNSAVLKLGVATLFRVAKSSLRVAKVYQDCPITLDLL